MKEGFNSKNIEIDSSILSETDDRSVMNPEEDLKGQKLFQHLKNKKLNKRPIEITEAKNMPTYFFICFIVVIFVMMFKFVPHFYAVADRNVKLKNLVRSKSLKYFSKFFGDLDVFSKVSLINKN